MTESDFGANWFVKDPFAPAHVLWPDVSFYDKQREIIQSVEDNDETFVVAGNQLGKDFVSAYIAISYFLRHDPCRILTTSIKDEHLIVLWGEISRFLQTARYPLLVERGGCLEYTHHRIRKVINGQIDEFSYLIGAVSKSEEGKAGHHARFTLIIGDEASGLGDDVYQASQGWAKRKLFIGNPNPSTSFFYKAVKGGDLRMTA